MMRTSLIPSISVVLILLGNCCHGNQNQNTGSTLKNFHEFQFEFEWRTGEWSKCEQLHHPRCCSVCVQTRRVTCVHTLKNITVPRHFCIHSNGLQGNVRPNEIRECEECDQDCVLSKWSVWSICDNTSKQYRTRKVLVLPSVNGQKCEVTIETRRCPRSKVCDGCEQRFRWKVGKWSECKSESGMVAGMGIRTRSVDCTNRRGNTVKPRRCLKARGMSRVPGAPMKQEMCLVRQDCQVSSWSDWSSCSLSCIHDPSKPFTGVQSRTRKVLTLPQNGGLVCPLLAETRTCLNTTLPKCTSFSWYTSFWSACTVLPKTADITSLADYVTDSASNVTSPSDEPGDADVTCGPGWQQRTVYCTLDSDKAKTPVNPLKCIQDDPLSLEPPTRRPCEVPCPRHCQLGEWGPWAPCSQSCGAGGVTTRSRPVLAEAMYDGEDCGVLSETTACAYAECSWWYTAAWKPCYPDGEATCGPGIRSRFVYCQSIDDRQLNDHECQTEKPPHTENCSVPCQQCLVSEWTQWSSCSQSCGPKPGTRTRTRNLLPGNPSGSCEKVDTVEWHPCGQRVCVSYSWRVGLWEECGVSEDTGRGQQSRQVVCVNDAQPDTPVTDDLCQATPRPPISQSCTALVPRDCVMTSWSDWTACSVTCGDSGRQARRRQVLIRQQNNGRICPPHDEQGLVFEYRACVRLKPCPEYKWSIDSSWSECVTGDRACGTGIVTRLVHCKYDSKVVDNAHCLRYDGKPPASSRQCYLPCPGDCSLSPWSEFGPCSQTCGTRPGFMVRRRYILAQRHASRPEGAHQVIHDPAQTDYSDSPVLPPYSLRPHAAPPPNSAHKRPASAGEVPPPRRLWQEHPSYDHASYILDKAAEQFQAPASALYRRKRSTGRAYIDGQVYGYPLHHLRRTSRRSGAYPYRRNVDYRTEYGTYPYGNVDYGAYSGAYAQRGPIYSSHYGAGGGEGHGRVYDGYGRVYLSPPTRQYRYGAYRRPYHEQVYYRDSAAPRLAPVIEDPHVDIAFRCPHLTDADLVERVPCGQERCPNYSWEVGEWGSCILANESAPCGAGTQFRSIQCRREGTAYAHTNQCLHQLHARPLGHKACNVSCPRDCQVSQWSEWTPCSQICGQGTRQRYRGVLVVSSEGGTPCPALEQLEVCEVRPCTDLQWDASEWSTCVPDYNLTCGQGWQHRDALCPAGESLESECERRSQRPITTRLCELACRGNCVVSEWGEFYPCNCELSVQYRHRTIVRKPAPGGYECGSLTESRRCRCPRYTLRVGNWTDCMPGLAPMWPSGVQRRSLACIQDGRYPVPLSLCGRHDIQTTRACQLPETRDCIVGEFGPWSHCGECGAHLSKQRHRPVLQAPSGAGRRCPPKHMLTQNTTCGLDPCNMFNYHWYVGSWSQCKVEGNGCGYGEQHRLVQCRRNDGVLVKQERCFLQDLQTGKSPVRYNTSQQCGSPCPKDCRVTEWSSFGPCYRNCSQPVGHSGYRVRTRSIIKPAGKNGASCPRKLVDVKSCSAMEAVCPLFQWQVTSDRPDVYCVSQGGVEVSGGCIESLRPAASWSCTDGSTCSVYAQCNQATRQCVCLDDYEGDGRDCFPSRGCREDSHCPINSTRCDVSRRVCICEDGSEPYEGLTCDKRWMAPADTTAALEPDFHIWIILGVCALFLVILVALAAVVFRRRPARGGVFGLNHMVSNNLSDIPKKVSNEYVNIRGTDRPRLAATSQDPQAASNPHYIYMNSEYKVQPRMGVSSSNFHLAVNTDELDDDVFTDNSEDVFLDPNHVYDDDVFLDTPENVRRRRQMMTFARQQQQQQRKRRESRGSRDGSQSSTSTGTGPGAGAGPPGVVLTRKRLSTDSSGRGSIRTRLASGGRVNSSGGTTPVHGCIVVRDKPSSSSGSSSSESLKLNPPSPPDYTPPPPPPPRPNLRSPPQFDFVCPASPKPELPPRSRPPLSMRRVATPVAMPSEARPPPPTPRSRSSQDIRLPNGNGTGTGSLICNNSGSESGESEPAETAPLNQRSRDSRESDGSATYLHLCEATWPT